MVRIRITQAYKEYKAGDIVEVTPNVAHGLLDSGIAIISKEMSSQDYKQSSNRGRKK